MASDLVREAGAPLILACSSCADASDSVTNCRRFFEISLLS